MFVGHVFWQCDQVLAEIRAASMDGRVANQMAGVELVCSAGRSAQATVAHRRQGSAWPLPAMVRFQLVDNTWSSADRKGFELWPLHLSNLRSVGLEIHRLPGSLSQTCNEASVLLTGPWF